MMIEAFNPIVQTKHYYQICDFRLVSNIPLLFPQEVAQEKQTADIIFTLKSPGIQTEEIFSTQTPIGTIKNGAGQPTIIVYKVDQGLLLDCNNGHEKVEFVIASDYSWIDCYPGSEVLQVDIEAWLFGLILSFLLQSRGIFSLHAAAVVCHEKAIAFLGNNGFGKSTMTLFFLQQGHALLTDDVLPIVAKQESLFVLPVCPSMNLWSNTIAHFNNSNKSLTRAATAPNKSRYSLEALKVSFCKSEVPLGGIYFLKPHRKDAIDRVHITSLPRAKALLELLSFTRANSMIPLPDQKNLLEIYARLISQIPVQCLEYPVGFEFLPEIYEVVLQDLIAEKK